MGAERTTFAGGAELGAGVHACGRWKIVGIGDAALEAAVIGGVARGERRAGAGVGGCADGASCSMSNQRCADRPALAQSLDDAGSASSCLYFYP